ncbi:hypothetical protein ACFX13_031289 [Malus domestica]
MEKAEKSMLMVEESEEVRVPPSGGNPFLKKAYFLKPTSQNSSIDIPLFQASTFFLLPSITFQAKEMAFEGQFSWMASTRK